MAARTTLKLLAALGGLTLGMLVINACGDDTTSPASGDGDVGDGDGKDLDGGSKPEPKLAADAVGKACSGNPDCGKQATCANTLTGGTAVGFLATTLSKVANVDIDLSTNVEGGYCTASCTSNDECNSGGVCFGIIEGLGLGSLLKGECRKACSINTDCRDGHECADVNPDAMAALNDALGDTFPIPAGAIPKTCIPAPKPVAITDEIVGKACSGDSECGGGTCAGASAATDTKPAVSGSCTSVCTEDAQCGATEGACTGIFYGTGGTCGEKCNQASDCKRVADGLTCQTVAGAKLCLPDTTPKPVGDAGAGDAGAGDAQVP